MTMLGLDPQESFLVEAHAGFGKTHMLTSRIVRLVLEGSPPESIVCITFTRCAAQEMRDRLAKIVHTLLDLENPSLDDFGIHAPGPIHIERLRHLSNFLFVEKKQMRINTIHAFCMDLLQGEGPFSLLEEEEEEKWRRWSLQTLLWKEWTSEDMALQTKGSWHLMRARAIVLEHMALKTLEDCFAQWEGEFSNHSFLPDLCEEAWRGCLLEKEPQLPSIPQGALDFVLEILQQSKAVTDQKAASRLDAYSKAIAHGATNPHAVFSAGEALFFTKAGERRASLVTKKMPQEVHDFLKVQEEQFLPFQRAMQIEETIALQSALHLFLQTAHMILEGRKREARKLNYNDILTLTLQMLQEDPTMVFSFLSSTRHILLDEAQDFSALQWQILFVLIEHLLESQEVLEEAQGAHKNPHTTRTFFCVGDAKQSIFSFQGADPSKLLALRKAFPKAKHLVRQETRRGAPLLVDFINHVLRQPFMQEHMAPMGIETTHILAPTIPQGENVGKISLQNLHKTQSMNEAEYMEVMAQSIGEKIRISKAGSTLILFRHHTKYVHILEKILQKNFFIFPSLRAPFDWQKHEICRHVMAALHFCLFPNDDLCLANLLLSPFIGMNHAALYALCTLRTPKQSLWDVLQQEETLHKATIDRLRAWIGLARQYAHAPGTFLLFLFAVLPSTEDAALEALLELAMEFSLSHTPSLAAFAQWLSGKKPFLWEKKHPVWSDGANEASNKQPSCIISTIHQAKGLEADLVILADTFLHPLQEEKPKRSPRLLPTNEPSMPFFFYHRNLVEHPFLEDHIARHVALENAENSRLIYVAITRAKKELVVLGWDDLAQDSWFGFLEECIGTFTREKSCTMLPGHA